MNKKQETQKSTTSQPAPRQISLMAIQEKLGLFSPSTPPETQETHQILTKKPLGYI